MHDGCVVLWLRRALPRGRLRLKGWYLFGVARTEINVGGLNQGEGCIKCLLILWGRGRGAWASARLRGVGRKSVESGGGRAHDTSAREEKGRRCGFHHSLT